MAEGVQFVLVGHDSNEMEGLVRCLRLVGLNAAYATVAVAERSEFDGRHIVVIDIDSEDGLHFSDRIAYELPDCVVATLSDHDRPVNRIMHILKPIGYIDIQILLIRAGAIVH